MAIRTVDVSEVRLRLAELLSEVRAGAEIVVTEGGAPIARLVPATARVAGLHAGTIWISDDFDEPLPEDFWTENT